MDNKSGLDFMTDMTEKPCVAVLIDTLGYYQEKFVDGIEAIFDPQGICTVVVQGRELNPESEHYKGANEIYQFAKGSQFVGVIVASSSLSHNTDLKTITEFVQSFDSKPLVSAGLEIPNVTSVVVDNKIGTENLIRHLVEVQGHKRFVFMRGFENNTDSILREQTVLSTLADYDLTIEPELRITGNFISNDAFTRMNALIAKRSDFDVVVAANDLMAFGVMKSLSKHGFRIPQDIAVTGFDDHQESCSAIPPLTTIRQPTFEIGQKAAELIVQQLEAKVVDDLYYLPTELIIRSSCSAKIFESKKDPVLSRTLESEAKEEAELSSLAEFKSLIVQTDEQFFLNEFKDAKFYEAKLLPVFSDFIKFRKNDNDLLRLFGSLLEEHNRSDGNSQLFFEFLDFIHKIVLETISDTTLLQSASNNFVQLYQILIVANQKELVQQGFEQLSALHDSRRYNLQLSLCTKYEEWNKVVIDVLEKTCRRAFVILYDDFENAENSNFQLVVATGSTIKSSIKSFDSPITFESGQILPKEFKSELRGKYYLMPLYVGQEKYGFMFIDTDDSQMLQYEAFAHGLSIAIRNSEQLQHLEQHTKKLEKANLDLATLANYDSLTGLPNRSLLTQRLDYACLSARDNDAQVALFFLDLDSFKYVNDSLGHDSGDELLKKVAQRLRAIVNSDDTVARLGGDEFTIVMVDVRQHHEVVKVAEKIIDVFNEPFSIKESTFRISASIGIAMFPEDNKDSSTLMKYADVAMYKAKKDGKNRYNFYNSTLSEEAFAQLRLAQQLRTALENNEMWVAFQPRFDIEGTSVLALEALARWNLADGTTISPAKFIPVAEKYGLIHEIGMHILRQACVQGKIWSENDDLISPSISVNLSANQLHEDNIVEQIAEVLNDVGLEPTLLELEITESVAMVDVEQNIKKLHQLRDLGVKIAIDDFGTAYSSLNYLKRLPVTSLKIDQSFVKDIDDLYDVTSNTAVIRAVIALGKSMDFNLVAEGVETAEQLAFLQHYECNEIQGFYLAKPMPASKVELLLRKSEQGDFVIPEGESKLNHKFYN